MIKPDLRHRLTDSVETALALADGLVAIDIVDGETMTFSERFACPEHGVGLPELQPRIFSFNSPHGACPRCTGLGAQQEIDPDLLVPDPSRLDRRRGARSLVGRRLELLRVRHPGDRRPLRDRPRPPVARPAEEQQNLFLYGTGEDKIYVTVPEPHGPQAVVHARFEGIVTSLERRYRETDSSQQRERIEEYMSFRPCPECKGARLKPEVLAVTVGDKTIHEFTRMSVTRSLEFLDGLELSETEQLIGERIIKEIRERLTFLDNVGVGYLQLDRASATLSGGEAQRLRLATQIGSQLVGVLYILDEPSIGLHQRDNDKLITTLERLRDLGNTVLVVEHDEQMMRSADSRRRHGAGRGRARRARDRRGQGRGHRAEPEVDHGPVPLGQADDRSAGAPHRRPRLVLRARGEHAQPEGDRRRVSGREVHLRHGRVGIGQVDARERDRLQGARQPAPPAAGEAGRSHRAATGSSASTR